MKRYCLRLMTFVGLFICLVLFLFLCRYWVSQKMSWVIPKEKHILVLGASHFERGFNDSLCKEAFNYSLSSERYLFTYLKLNHLIKDNPQIDMVLLQCAPTDLWEHTDDKYYIENEQLKFVPLYLPFTRREDWFIYKENPLRVVKIFFKSLVSPRFYKEHTYRRLMGGYIGDSDNKNELDTTQVIPQMIEGEYGHVVNYYYLHKIIDSCKISGIKLYFVYCPVYHPEYFYDQDYYYNALENEFSEVELLDYSQWQMAQDEMYDAHHLNYKGARRFTEEIKRRLKFE